jgi:hypothetical protein
MKILPAALLLGLLIMLAGTGAARADKHVSKADALAAIGVFSKDPSSKEGFAAGATLLAYTKSSDSVHVYLSKDALPWLKDKNADDSDTRDMLVTAYLAGNVRSQILKGNSYDDPYSGWQQVFLTYAQLKAINPTVKFSEVDDLKEKDKDGTLRAYADKIAAKHAAEQSKK